MEEGTPGMHHSHTYDHASPHLSLSQIMKKYLKVDIRLWGEAKITH